MDNSLPEDLLRAITAQGLSKPQDAGGAQDMVKMPQLTLWHQIVSDPEQWNERLETLKQFVPAWGRLFRVPVKLLPPCWYLHSDHVAVWGILHDVIRQLELPGTVSGSAEAIARLWFQVIYPELERLAKITVCRSGEHVQVREMRWYDHPYS